MSDKSRNKKLLIICILSFLNIKSLEISASSQGQMKQKQFGGWWICKALFDHIRTILPEGKTILELGSGQASSYLSEHYKVYSIEHSTYWLNKYNTRYIYAPIKNRWYDVDVLHKWLPDIKYDLILVDGPPELESERYGFYKNLELFNTEVPIIFDDIDRDAEFNLMKDVAKKLNKSFEIYECEQSANKIKKFGIVQ